MKKRTWIWVVGTVALLMACGQKDLRNFEKVVHNAETNAATYTEADWKQADEAFKAFTAQYSTERMGSMSEEQRREVGRLVVRYTRVRLEYASRQLLDITREAPLPQDGLAEETDLEEYPREVERLYEEMEGALERFEEVMGE